MQNPESEIVHFPKDAPLTLDGGGTLAPFSIAYQAYGTLNDQKSNVVLVCHAITGDQHVANTHPVTGKAGWWDTMVGPGKPVDTDRYFVICSNVLSGCMGSTGPSSIDPESGRAYGLDFPVITIGDMVRAQARLLDHLEIPDLFCVIGGSMGGMQVLEWATSYKDRVFAAIPIATSAKHSSQNIAFHEVGRQAVMADPDWRGGAYLEHDTNPRKGLAVARMAAHITYLSDEALHRKFGRNLQDRERVTFGFDADFQVESYLRHQGYTFVERFDANSYIYMTRSMDYFDLATDHGGKLANAFKGTETRFCVVSFTSDWLFPTEDNREIVQALNAVAANVSFVEIESDKGHDAFLLHEPELFETISGFLNAAARRRGLHERDDAKEAGM
ncbi:MAG: homoserine O-acetyltransferase MetX [Methyloligellaceae bacterium]